MEIDFNESFNPFPGEERLKKIFSKKNLNYKGIQNRIIKIARKIWWELDDKTDLIFDKNLIYEIWDDIFKTKLIKYFYNPSSHNEKIGLNVSFESNENNECIILKIYSKNAIFDSEKSSSEDDDSSESEDESSSEDDDSSESEDESSSEDEQEEESEDEEEEERASQGAAASSGGVAAPFFSIIHVPDASQQSEDENMGGGQIGKCLAIFKYCITYSNRGNTTSLLYNPGPDILDTNMQQPQNWISWEKVHLHQDHRIWWYTGGVHTPPIIPGALDGGSISISKTNLKRHRINKKAASRTKNNKSSAPRTKSKKTKSKPKTTKSRRQTKKKLRGGLRLQVFEKIAPGEPSLQDLFEKIAPNEPSLQDLISLAIQSLGVNKEDYYEYQYNDDYYIIKRHAIALYGNEALQAFEELEAKLDKEELEKYISFEPKPKRSSWHNRGPRRGPGGR